MCVCVKRSRGEVKGERENSIELNGDRRERGAFIAVATQSGPRSSSVSGDAERAVNEGAGGTCASALNNNSVGPRTERTRKTSAFLPLWDFNWGWSGM